MTLPRVTVVVVATPADEGPDGALMHSVHSVEQQTYPRELVDTHIVRNVDGSPLTTMRRFGVGHADTEWVAFIDVHQEWPPAMLATLVERVQESPVGLSFAGTGLCDGKGYGTIIRKDYFLETVS
jgi:hypothetical protein